VLDAADPLFLFAAAALFFLARRPLGGLLGRALRLAAGGQVVLLAALPIVLDPTQLLQRKQNGILTPIGHGSPLLARFAQQLKRPRLPSPGVADHLNEARSLSMAALSRVDLGPVFLSSPVLLATAEPAPAPLPLALALP